MLQPRICLQVLHCRDTQLFFLPGKFREGKSDNNSSDPGEARVVLHLGPSPEAQQALRAPF